MWSCISSTRLRWGQLIDIKRLRLDTSGFLLLAPYLNQGISFFVCVSRICILEVECLRFLRRTQICLRVRNFMTLIWSHFKNGRRFGQEHLLALVQEMRLILPQSFCTFHINNVKFYHPIVLRKNTSLTGSIWSYIPSGPLWFVPISFTSPHRVIVFAHPRLVPFVLGNLYPCVSQMNCTGHKRPVTVVFARRLRPVNLSVLKMCKGYRFRRSAARMQQFNSCPFRSWHKLEIKAHIG